MPFHPRVTYMCRLFILICLAAIGGDAWAQNSSTVFTPQRGFSGRSEGNGVLHLFFSQKPFHVESRGFVRQDGSFQLDQAVKFSGKNPEYRTWIISQSSGDLRYSGSLSGASGVVTGETIGATLTLRYRVKGPIVVHQTLTLLPDGKSIDNQGQITLLGIPIGSMSERIFREE